jgi:ParB-like chromosome segregation protein Spo0J
MDEHRGGNMVKLLAEDRAEFTIRLADLHSLEEAKFPHADLAHRDLDQQHLETQVLSGDPKTWPPILLVKTELLGYVIVDGYHRKEAARIKGMDEIRATSKTFPSESAVVEAFFTENAHHGLKLNQQNRSNYAYWLHLTYPEMEQQEIARRAGIKQSTVSKAISRREAAKTTGKGAAARGAHEKDEQHELIRRACERLTHDAVKLYQDIETLDEREQRAAIAESLQRVEDREALLKIATILERVLKPRAAPRAKKPAGAAR